MLTELYIKALADEVWVLWVQGLISDELAAWAWLILVVAVGK